MQTVLMALWFSLWSCAAVALTWTECLQQLRPLNRQGQERSSIGNISVADPYRWPEESAHIVVYSGAGESSLSSP